MTDSPSDPRVANNIDGSPADVTTGSVSYGKTAGSGFSWLSMLAVFGKVLHFLTQIVLGWFLLDEDFGVFAIATALATFVKAINDGGVAHVLVQKGEKQFSRLAGIAFWTSFSFSMFLSLLLAAMAPLAAYLYGEEQLIPVLLLMALSMPFSALTSVFNARIRLDLRFEATAWLGILWFTFRYLGTVVLAWQGFGVLSFVLPLPFAAALGLVTSYWATKIQPWKAGCDIRLLPEIIGSSFWVTLAAFLRGLARNGDYLVLGAMISTAALGQYFFGYQMTAQLTFLLAVNVQTVLFPILTKLVDELERQLKAAVRTIRIIMLVAAPFSLMIAVSIESLEALIWDGKWAMAVPLMQIFAVVAPIRLLPEIVHAMIMSRGEFRKSALLVLTEGIVLVISAWAAALLFDVDITRLAMFIGICQMLFSIVLTLTVLGGYGIAKLELLRAFIPTWITAIVCAAITVALRSLWTEDLPLAAGIAVDLLTYGVLFLAIVRFFFPSQLEELAGAIPGVSEDFVRKVCLLNHSLSN